VTAVPDRLLDDGELHDSSVVANCAMNRERQLAGVNSYANLGADDRAGPNYTGQPAVDSVYQERP